MRLGVTRVALLVRVALINLKGSCENRHWPTCLRPCRVQAVEGKRMEITAQDNILYVIWLHESLLLLGSDWVRKRTVVALVSVTDVSLLIASSPLQDFCIATCNHKINMNGSPLFMT